MDIEKLIAGLSKEAYGSDVEELLLEAATALSTLQAKNKKLFAELARVTAERDAAQALLAERSGVIGSAPITTAFGVPLDRLKELVEADREGRCVVFPCKPGETVYQLTLSACKWWETKKCDRCHGYGACWEGTTIIEPAQFEPDMIDSVGTDIFLTCAEAEEALRKGQE